MKNRIPFSLLPLFVVLSCSQKLLPTNNVVYLNSSTDSITLKTTGYGNQEEQARQNALERALETVLFQGIPEARFAGKEALVSQNKKDKFQEFFNNFFEQRKFLEYIPSNTIISSTKTKSKFTTVVSAQRFRPLNIKFPMPKNL
jgi:coenzyme F420-reducing hydrogenase delta subunit